MCSIYPPLLLDMQLFLKIEQQISRRHGATSEEMRCHPALLEVVRCAAVGKNVNKQLATRLQGARNLRHKQLVIFHVLEKLKILVTGFKN